MLFSDGLFKILLHKHLQVDLVFILACGTKNATSLTGIEVVQLDGHHRRKTQTSGIRRYFPSSLNPTFHRVLSIVVRVSFATLHQQPGTLADYNEPHCTKSIGNYLPLPQILQ